MEFINLTPHALTLEGVGTIAPSGTIARVQTARKECATIAGVRITRQTTGVVWNLPLPEAGKVYIVSGMVLGALAGTRPDVFAPDTGSDAIRENGQIVAVRGLVC